MVAAGDDEQQADEAEDRTLTRRQLTGRGANVTVSTPPPADTTGR